MRIPLDYYQILSVPIKTSASQLEQAYRDRLLQQPRREYNEQAIEARQALIQRAYQVLADSEQRAEYDAQFFVNMQPVAEVLPVNETAEADEDEAVEDLWGEELEAKAELSIPEVTPPVLPITPTIEISADELIGALLILHELGEYELALQLGVERFNSPEFSLEDEVVLRSKTQENIILSIALAYMEIGREQWHRHEYEHAALSGQMGINLLQRENLFSQIQAELQLDLYKLRPYRVLELISQNQAGSPERTIGFKLLREMLVQRQGIEGKGQDRSGLSFDQFLCFVQQLRTYLTSQEQQELFDSDSQKESAIANYLAVYALLSRGFTLKQPELVLRAQRKLDYLSQKQDVAWEQAVSALLLGHTEKAIAKLQNSQDLEKIEQVQRHSDLNTDLLPGMCLYGEKWLQDDVVAQFADLADTRLTLKEYFGDRQVQEYLEELTLAGAAAIGQTAVETAPSPQHANPTVAIESNKSEAGIFSRWRTMFGKERSGKEIIHSTATDNVSNKRELVSAGVAVKELNGSVRVHNQAVSQTKNKSKFRQTVAKNSQTYFEHPAPPATSLSLPLESQNRAVPVSVIQKAQGKSRQKRLRHKKKRRTSTLIKGWLFIFGLLGAGTIGFIAMKMFMTPNSPEQLAVTLAQPGVEAPPKPKPKPAAVKPKLTFSDESARVIQQWLSSKSAAFGKEHKIERLEDILAEPLLATWRDRATAHQQSNSYREYDHRVTMRSAKVDPNNPKKAVVEAEVKEVAKHYQAGQLDSAQSYDDNLLVRYQLVLQGENWLIQEAEVLKTL